MHRSDLINIGLNERFLKEAEGYEVLYVGRVSSQHKDMYSVITAAGEIKAVVSGRFRYLAGGLAEYPAVGDFVMLDRTDNARGQRSHSPCAGQKKRLSQEGGRDSKRCTSCCSQH